MKPRAMRRILEQWTVEHSGFELSRDYLGMSQIWRCPRELVRHLREGRARPELRGSLGCYEGRLHKRDLVDRLQDLGVFEEARELIAPWSARLRGHPDGIVDGELVIIKSVTVRMFDRIQEVGYPRRRDEDQMQLYLLYGGLEFGMVIYKCRETGQIWAMGVRANAERQLMLEGKARRVLAALDSGRELECTCGRCE